LEDNFVELNLIVVDKFSQTYIKIPNLDLFLYITSVVADIGCVVIFHGVKGAKHVQSPCCQ
jgi:hypothetical protein